VLKRSGQWEEREAEERKVKRKEEGEEEKRGEKNQGREMKVEQERAKQIDV
jgi:hypothetical protein